MRRLVRVGGWAAILAGVLRSGVSFVSGSSDVERQSFYFVVDLLVLLSVFAAHAQNHEATSIAFTFEGVTIPELTTRIHTPGPCGEQAELKASGWLADPGPSSLLTLAFRQVRHRPTEIVTHAPD